MKRTHEAFIVTSCRQKKEKKKKKRKEPFDLWCSHTFGHSESHLHSTIDGMTSICKHFSLKSTKFKLHSPSASGDAAKISGGK